MKFVSILLTIFISIFLILIRPAFTENELLDNKLNSQLKPIENELLSIKNSIDPLDQRAFYFMVIDLLNEIFPSEDENTLLEPIINEADTLSQEDNLTSSELDEINTTNSIQNEESVILEEIESDKEILDTEILDETSSLSIIEFFTYFFLFLMIIIGSFIAITFARKKGRDPSLSRSYKLNKEPTVHKKLKRNEEKDSSSLKIEESLEFNNQNISEVKTYGEETISDESDYKSGMGFSIFTEKVVSKGEDSRPILSAIDDNVVFISVCDGLGGAGASEITAASGEKHTSAYFGANILYDYFVKQCNNKNSLLLSDEIRIADELKLILNNELKNFSSKETGIISKKPSKLPSTFAGILITDTDNQNIKITSLWAGDSRCYALTIDNGLEMCSVDDVKEQDPMELLTADSPMTNYINAEGKFTINRKDFKFDKPVIFLTATDGCFSYFSNPMYFEYVILKTLEESSNIDEWKSKLQSEIVKVSQDDATLSLCCFGWKEFSNLRETYAGKSQALYDQYIKSNEDNINEINRIKNELKNLEEKNKTSTENGLSEYIKNRFKK